MEQLVTFIGDVGFPIILSLLLIYRMEEKLDRLILEIQQLPEKLVS